MNREVSLNLPEYGAEDRSLLENMRRFGILKSDNNGVADFQSPLARRFTLNWLHPERPTRNPSSIRVLLETALEKISRSALLSTMQSGFPVEAVFQAHLLHAFIASTPVGCRTIPEMSTLFRDESGEQGRRVEGRIDFYINDTLRWGVELLVNGDRVGEHLFRFTPHGRYATLAVADYMVIDLRRGRAGNLPHNRVIWNVLRHEKKSTVFFDPAFKFCDVVHGYEEVANTIHLRS